jgi:small subunit ribosomal protein S9
MAKQQIQYYQAVGRRRESVARVRLHLCTKENVVTLNGKKYEKGSIVVNGKKFEEVYNRPVDHKRCSDPFNVTESNDRFVTTVSVEGGGKIGQLDAIIHGISRALVLAQEEDFKPLLRQEGYITRDSRIRERRKVGKGGKARKAKQSPKR